MRTCWVFLVAAAACGTVTPLAAAGFPHEVDLAAGVRAVGFADRYQSANCGWIEMADTTLLVDLPRGIAAAEFLAAARQATGKAVGAIVLTHAATEDAPLVAELRERGVRRIYLSTATHRSLIGAVDKNSDASTGYETIARSTILGEGPRAVEILPMDEVFERGGLAVHLPGQKVLFAGPAVIHGPRAPLVGADTENWIAVLRRLATLDPAHVVPGFGSWGGAELLDRQRRMHFELRRQVGYFIAQGRPHEDLIREVRLAADVLVWMPYDTPLAEDVEHVYAEMTVPRAPFRGRPPAATDSPPHALVLIGDQPHEPGHIEEGLRPVFEATGVVPHFTVDVRALSAESLARVRLLVILRDGLQRPQSPGQQDYMWMTSEQERAVVEFVHGGGGFLNLHNAMGLYPDNGPYLNLVGGRYIGHGPLERFRVEVVDREHPVTRGVEAFSVADEQHTPPFDEKKVHLLLRNRSDDGQTAAAGWAYEPGRGRLCHLASGHTREALEHPMYQRLLRNAVHWCLRQDGAPAAAPAGKAE